MREWKDLCKGHRFSLHATTVPWPAIPCLSVNLVKKKKGKKFLEAAKDVESEAQALALLMSEVKNGFLLCWLWRWKIEFYSHEFHSLARMGILTFDEITFQQFSRAQARVAKHTWIHFISLSSKRSMLCIVAQSFDTVQSFIIFQYRTINYRSIRESEESHSSPIFINFLLISSRKTFIFNLFLLLCFSRPSTRLSIRQVSSIYSIIHCWSRSSFSGRFPHRTRTSLIFHRALPISLQIRQQTPKSICPELRSLYIHNIATFLSPLHHGDQWWAMWYFIESEISSQWLTMNRGLNVLRSEMVLIESYCSHCRSIFDNDLPLSCWMLKMVITQPAQAGTSNWTICVNCTINIAILCWSPLNGHFSNSKHQTVIAWLLTLREKKKCRWLWTFQPAVISMSHRWFIDWNNSHFCSSTLFTSRRSSLFYAN